MSERRDDATLIEIVARVIELRRTQQRISPSWVATEAWLQLDPAKAVQHEHPLIYIGCHLQLRQIARELLRQRFEPVADDAQHKLFPALQTRYPSARSAGWDEPEYVVLDALSKADVDYNVDRLRREGRAKLRHADALAAWGRGRFKPPRRRRA